MSFSHLYHLVISLSYIDYIERQTEITDMTSIGYADSSVRKAHEARVRQESDRRIMAAAARAYPGKNERNLIKKVIIWLSTEV